MSYFDQLVDALLDEVAVRDEALAEARSRRDRVRNASKSFKGATGTYMSGSLAYGTAIRPVNDRDKGVDGDCGVILDRRFWPALGPDSKSELGPQDVVDEVREHLRERLKDEYPGMRVSTTEKRAIRITFSSPLDTEDGDDPPVELIVALTRKGKPGLWIPNLKANDWNPAHPELHRKLINSDPGLSLRRRRARIVRLAKQWNKKRSTPAFSSFHLQALALEAITSAETNRPLTTTLETYFRKSAEMLDEGMTQDPAGVSGVLNLQNGVVKSDAVKRLHAVADTIAELRKAPNDKDLVREGLGSLFGEDVVNTAHDQAQARALAEGNTDLAASSTGISIASPDDRTARRVTTRNPNAWRAQ